MDGSKYPINKWSEIVTELCQRKPELIRVELTAYEYRKDARDIVYWKGQRVAVPIDSLAWNNECGAESIKQEILQCYQQLNPSN